MHFLTEVEQYQFDTNKKLKGQIQVLYLKIREHCFGEKNQCFPSQKRLAEMLHIDERTIRRHLNVLYDSGLVQKTRRGKKITNLYTLPLKSLGIMAKNIEKKGKEIYSKKVSNVTGQVCTTEYTKYINDDNYTSVQNIISEFITAYGSEVVNKALERIKGKTISIKGFFTYFKKVIDTILSYATKKTYKGFRKDKLVSTFNNFEQRTYNFKELERKLLGWGEDCQYDESIVTGAFTPKTISKDNFNNHPQRTYDFKELEKGLLGW